MPTIGGTQGDDVLTGTVGDDIIVDEWGDDIIDAGAGNDTIIDNGGSNTILAGSGDDFIEMRIETYGGDVYGMSRVFRTNVVDAGDGADVVHVTPYGPQDLDISLGAGADQLIISSLPYDPDSVSITTGSGADRIVFDERAGGYFYNGSTPIYFTISDFTVGVGGDVLDIGEVVERVLRDEPHAANPFADGRLVLVQDGADVIVRIQIFGADYGHVYNRDIVRLENVNAADLTTYNLAGYDPSGGALVRTTVNGTSGSEWLHADVGGSDLNGLGGNDRLTGNIGADSINGGAGNDILSGGSGNDVLDGGTENDTLDGGAGNDVVRGGAGDDVLTDPSGSDLLDGGAGNDIIDIVRGEFVPNLGPVTILGGDGDDYVRFDVDLQNKNGGDLIVDLGAGNDRFIVPSYLDSVQLTLGAGQDHVILNPKIGDPTPLVITDFAVGNSGDVLELDRFFVNTAITNPFSDGYLFLEQDGADTLVMWDYDGNGPSTTSYVFARLSNVNAGSLTAFNFGGYVPTGAPSSFTLLQGTAGDDHLYGTNAADTINGGDGNDLIEETKGGSDTINGGNGDDSIILGHYSPTVVENVTINAGAGRDFVNAAAGTGNLTVDLGADDDRIVLWGSDGHVHTITLGTGSDTIEIRPGFYFNGWGAPIITDFQTGAGGDRLDWAMFVEGWNGNGSEDYNPFLEDNARLVQVGSDVHLQLSGYNPTQAIPNFTTMLVFANTTVANFTSYNLGYNLYFPTQTGTTGDDVLAGTAGADVVQGDSGNDQVSGDDGNDVIRGQDGNDTLNGGLGDDFLRGGSGSDVLNGDAGNDNLNGEMGTDTVNGGDGNDRITDYYGTDQINGGTGDDNIYVRGASSGSVDAGDGNDIVEITGTNTSYSINLGAGDDTLILNSGGTQPVILGAGRDTVTGSASGLVISDFQTGDSGDIIDLASLINTQLGYILGLTEWDPFEAGYVQLKQVGSEVRVYVYPDGYNTGQYPSTPLIRFLNTDISQFTSANFGGVWDPQAAPPVRTIQLSSDYTNNANRTFYDVTPINGSGSTAFMLNFGVGSTLTNNATVTLTQDAAFGGAATGIWGGPAPAGATFVNSSSGILSVNYGYVPPNGILSGGSPTARGTLGVPTVQNNGIFQVTAASGVACGVQEAALTNTGTFTVTSAYDAYGVYNQDLQGFSNTGTINVHGDDFAIGLYYGDIRTSGFTNAGTIIVSTDPSSPYASIGVYMSESAAPSGFVFESFNSGTITADIAFMVENDHTTNLLGKDLLHNSGTMNGDVILSFGDDTVDNSGTIRGSVLLGAGDDRYDGATGFNYGTVEGGTGNDVLVGGINADFLYGDEGDDTINGGFGNDFIEGGRGSDTLAGESGSGDVVAYDESLMGVTVDLAAGTASDGIDVDTLSGFEGVVGSRFNDTIRGASSIDTLFGGDGDDHIDGGIGADTIRGGSGSDDLTGGAGNDIFLFSVGDGIDIIRDFTTSDRLSINGYSGPLSITQVGANVVVSLSGTDEITLLGTTVAIVQAGLQQSGVPLADAYPVVDRAVLQANGDDLVIPAGVTVSLTDPADLRYRDAVLPGRGVVLTSVTVTDETLPNFYNAGTFSFVDSGQPLITGISKRYLYGSDQNNFVNGATGSIVIHNLSGDVIGVDGITQTFNFGSISVIADGGDATGFTDLPPGAYVYNYLVNAGSVSVEATGTALGLGQVYGSSSSIDRIFNSGTVTIHGGESSTGFNWIASARSVGLDRPHLVNSGQIVVTDETAARDSAAIRTDWAIDSAIWNSGTLQGDYAIKRGTAFSGAAINATLSIYNSGQMIGDVDLYGGNGQNAFLLNTGSIVGNVKLTNGNDTFDSRGGTFVGNLSGMGGNDTLLGGAGSQTILGGLGDDVLSGGAGNDILTGGAGADRFRYETGFGIDTITDFDAAIDRIDVRGYAAWQSIVQQGGDVVVTFATGDQLIFKNQLLANITASLFTFGADAIAANSIPAAPIAPNAPAIPISEATGGLAPIYGTAASNTLNGTSAADALSGAAGNDTLNGSGGNDRLDGGTGNDTLNGGAGSDFMAGGEGNDTYVVDDSFDVVTEQAAEGIDLVQSSIAYVLGRNLENLTLTGSAAISGIGNELGNTLRGNGADNALNGGGGDDYLFGNAGNDSLVGGAGYDRMYGGTGNDNYYVNDLTDFAYENAGEGRDTVTSSIDHTLRDNIEDLVLTSSAYIGKGNILDNVISGNGIGNKLYGYEGNDTLNGQGGDDYLFGAEGNDVLTGGAGYDRMYGGVGDDIYYVTDSTDFAYENLGEGNDRVISSLVSYQLRANVEELTLAEGSGAVRGYGQASNNVLVGNSANNFLYGRDGDDVIKGNAGNDILYGENGNDTLYGGSGQDRFYGGAGADKFVFRDGDLAGMGSGTADRIHDFDSSEGDKIHLTGIDANSLLGGDQAFAFIGAAEFSATAGELRAYQSNGNTYVSGDVDGDGIADFVIRVDGLHSFTIGDFYL